MEQDPALRGHAASGTVTTVSTRARRNCGKGAEVWGTGKGKKKAVKGLIHIMEVRVPAPPFPTWVIWGRFLYPSDPVSSSVRHSSTTSSLSGCEILQASRVAWPLTSSLGELMRSLPAGQGVFGVKCSNKRAGRGRAKMRQKDGKRSFALRKLRSPLSANG